MSSLEVWTTSACDHQISGLYTLRYGYVGREYQPDIPPHAHCGTWMSAIESDIDVTPASGPAIRSDPGEGSEDVIAVNA